MSLINDSTIQKMAAGVQTTVTASDTVQTTLTEVLHAVATLESDPILACAYATVAIPDQVANPGKILVKTWMPTSSSVTTPIAATTFGKTVRWIVFGR